MFVYKYIYSVWADCVGNISNRWVADSFLIIWFAHTPTTKTAFVHSCQERMQKKLYLIILKKTHTHSSRPCEFLSDIWIANDSCVRTRISTKINAVDVCVCVDQNILRGIRELISWIQISLARLNGRVFVCACTGMICQTEPTTTWKPMHHIQFFVCLYFLEIVFT